MPRRLAQQRMTLSDLEWLFYASRAISAVAEILGLESLHDLLMCYKIGLIIHKQMIIHKITHVYTNDFLIFADSVMIRGHRYKLFKRYSDVNASKLYVTSAIIA